MNDKEIEKKRYNEFSKQNSDLSQANACLKSLGANSIPDYCRPPYTAFEKHLENLVKSTENTKLLDLCCGDGIHSFTGALYGADVIALDYAENSIILAKRRSELVGVDVDFRTCDVENLPFETEKFDIVTCVGSLSYLNHEVFINEVMRVLKPNGKFICIDSFNHNPIYRLNRYIHYLKGNRTYSTLKRMPNNELLKIIKNNFSELDVEYFGIFVFLVPFLKFLTSPKKISRFLNNMDSIFNSIGRRYSFKILFVATK
jgi:ubiquinone/menaquinone biosynthesis C-methylase UbiE